MAGRARGVQHVQQKLSLRPTLAVCAEGQKEAKLYLEGQIDITEGISEALLQSFIATHLACAFFSKDPFHKVTLRRPKPRRKTTKNGDGQNHDMLK